MKGAPYIKTYPDVGITIYSELPRHFNMYFHTDIPCWYITLPYEDEDDWLRSTRVIIISKETGEVLHEGNIGDEG